MVIPWLTFPCVRAIQNESWCQDCFVFVFLFFVVLVIVRHSRSGGILFFLRLPISTIGLLKTKSLMLFVVRHDGGGLGMG